MQAAITVLIVDDQALVRESMKRILEDVPNLNVVAEASNGEEAIRAAKSTKPSLVIMTIKIPGLRTLKIMQSLLQADPDVKVLMLSGAEDDALASRSLQAGAMGFITKKVSANEFVQAIKSISLGKRYIGQKLVGQLALKNISSKHASPFDELSGRELQVTLMQIDGLSVEEMAEKLNVSPKTINSYRYRIFEKLEVKNDVELILLAVKYGIKTLDFEEN